MAHEGMKSREDFIPFLLQGLKTRRTRCCRMIPADTKQEKKPLI